MHVLHSGTTQGGQHFSSISQHAPGQRRRTSLHRSTGESHSVVLRVKRKVRADPRRPSLCSAESAHISPDMNAQRGASILPAVQRPRDSLSQPLPFTACRPLSKKAASLPPLASYSSVVPRPPLQTSASRCITAGAPVLWVDPPLCSPLDTRSIRRKK